MSKISEVSVLEKLNAGVSVEDAAKLFGCDVKIIEQMQADFFRRGLIRGKPFNSGSKMDHSAKLERRKAIARFIAEGHTYPEAAQQFGVSVPTVAKAVQEFGAQKRPDGKQASQAEIFKIAAMFVRGSHDKEIADAMEMTRQRVSQIRAEAEEAGLFQAIQEVAQAVAARAG